MCTSVNGYLWPHVRAYVGTAQKGAAPPADVYSVHEQGVSLDIGIFQIDPVSCDLTHSRGWTRIFVCLFVVFFIVI